MDILKTSTDWAKAELLSSAFFLILSIVFIMVSVAFWQLAKTELAKAYVVPFFVAGVLFSIIGAGLTYTNSKRISEFPVAYSADSSAFVEAEITRVDATLNQYTVVFKVVPIIIAICALLIILLDTPTWRAVSITTIAMMAVILLIDGTANSRIDAYKDRLMETRGRALAE